MLPHAKEVPEAEESPGTDLALHLQKKQDHADTLTLDLWHPKLQTINSCCFKSPNLWYFVMTARGHRHGILDGQKPCAEVLR